MPVLQVPAGEEGGPGGLPNLMKENNKGEDEEEKKEADYNEEKKEGEEEGQGGYAGQPGGGGGHNGQTPLGPFCHLSPFPAAPALRFFPSRRS